MEEIKYPNKGLMLDIRHISKIDRHVPFTDPSIKRIVDFINPQYLVYEFITDSFKELEQYIETQNRALDF